MTTSTATRLPVFVYGTLRSGQGNYRRILEGMTVSEQVGTLAGARMLDNGSYPFVVRTDDASETVVGEVMTIADDAYDATLVRLDRLEGYRPNSSHNLYDRTVVTITVADGSTVEALVYVAGGYSRKHFVEFLPHIPSGDWLTHLASQLADDGQDDDEYTDEDEDALVL